MNTLITYKGSDGNYWTETACAKHLPGLLLNVQRTWSVNETYAACDVCDVDGRSADSCARCKAGARCSRHDTVGASV